MEKNIGHNNHNDGLSWKSQSVMSGSSIRPVSQASHS